MNTLKFLHIFKPKMSKFVDNILVMKLFISIINYFFFTKKFINKCSSSFATKKYVYIHIKSSLCQHC